MRASRLDAWLYGTLVATIRRDPADRLHLDFAPEVLQRWGVGSSVLSGLLPLREESPSPAAVRAWLRGLLPEGRARTRAAEAAGVDPDDVLAFLAAYGRDTAGAVVLVPEGQDPGRPLVPLRGLDDEAIGVLLDDAARWGAFRDQLTSLGGLEPKIVLVETPEGFALPTPTVPSTHLAKLARPDASASADLIDTEHAAMQLAALCGLGSVETSVRSFAGRRVILVRRYDRLVESGPPLAVARLHQEDAAQLLGIDTTDPERKFQHGKVLPSLRAIARALTDMGADPRALLALTTFNLAIGNTDAHARNISVLHDETGGTRLAPAYDVAMHLHHHHAERRFAMDVAGERQVDRIDVAHLVQEGVSWGVPQRAALTQVRGTLERLAEALAAMDREAHPGVSPAAWHVVVQRTAALLAGAPRAQSPALPRVVTRARAPRGTPTGGRFLPDVGEPHP